MNRLLHFLIFATAILTLGCQGQNTETIREIIREPVPGNQVQEGGVDSGGGGNGVNGRPLESYAVRILDITEFNTVVMPIIQKMHEIHPRFASDMAHIALNRTWYLIPVELNKLPAQVIGVSFGDKQLQQLALQNLNAVWINSDLFQKYPTDQDRGTLLLHEIIMGVRLMKYKSNLDQCYSGIASLRFQPEKAPDYKRLRDECAMKHGLNGTDNIIGGINQIKLTKDDYDNIRELVVVLLRGIDDLSKTQLDAWLKDRSFRSY